MFFHAFLNYDYEKVCDQLETLHRFEGESFNDFIIQFKLICLQFKIEYLPSIFELTKDSNTHHEQEDSIASNEFNVVDESIVGSIYEKNAEITNKQTWENKNMTVSNTDTVKEEVQQ